MRRDRKSRKAIVVATVCFLLAAQALAEDWTPPTIEQLPTKYPVITCTPDELARLQAAYRGNGSEQKIVAAVVAAAQRQVDQEIEFPPRGGQHNQWYQCDSCQIALKTLDATHHQCPKCKTVYSGEPYDDVLFARVHGRNAAAV